MNKDETIFKREKMSSVQWQPIHVDLHVLTQSHLVPLSPEQHYNNCDCPVLYGPFGTLLSPGYPETYHRMDCTWRIEVNPGQVSDMDAHKYQICSAWT